MRLCCIIILSLLTICSDGKSRQKRYLVFPEGSSLSIAICMTAQMGITPGEIFTEGINWGISYELPNDTKDFRDLAQQTRQAMQRRHRRDLFNKLEIILNSMGYNGKNCILRTICEVSKNFKTTNRDLLDEFITIIFKYPTGNIYLEDIDVKHQQYNEASYHGSNNEKECFELFPDCSFSLIDLLYGYYSNYLDPLT